MDRLKGKVAVITGGNSGVGEATAKLFAKEGAVVVITARREAALTKVAEEIKAAGGEAFAVSTDISKPEDPERLMELVLKKYGKIDILINNAGILETGLKPIDRFLDEDLGSGVDAAGGLVKNKNRHGRYTTCSIFARRTCNNSATIE